MSRGQFITIEGSEGVGKSTNITFIREYLESKGVDLLVTREPGGTPLAENIRELLLAKREENVDDLTELLLMFAARAQHIHQLIEPALASGTWVLCDRFTDSTFAYQGGGRGLDDTVIHKLELLVQQDFQPDVTFYLDIDVKIGLARAAERAELDRFESEKIEFFERVRAAYLQRVNVHPERFCVIDASGSLSDVQAAILKKLTQVLKKSDLSALSIN